MTLQRTDYIHSDKSMPRLLSLLFCSLTTTSCAPPSLRAAHSMDRGDVSFEVGASIDDASHTTEILTLEGEDSLPMRQRPVADFMAVFGLGKGFEIGIGQKALVKYSMLDERRHTTPMSLAVAIEGSGPHYFAGGFLMSSNLQINDTLAFRPIANIWFSNRTFTARMPVEGSHVAPNSDTETKGFSAKVHYQGIDFPIGFEMPIRAGHKWSVVPTVAFTPGMPINIDILNARCSGCMFALEEFKTGVPMSFFAGLRMQPQLREANQRPAPTPAPEPTESPESPE
jgi:hypothetical protein